MDDPSHQAREPPSAGDVASTELSAGLTTPHGVGSRTM